MSYADWTIQEVYDKADWEGGICGLIEYGGSAVFTALGPEALAAAEDIQKGMRVIQAIFDQYEQMEG